MDMQLELVIIPVTDIDRSKAFYEQVGFTCDTDHRAGDFRIVQLTPPGSACSVGFGTGITTAEPGSAQGLHLVVTEIEAAVADLRGRGVEVGDPFHFGAEGRADGVDPRRQDYATFAELSDPDGNVWLLQEIASRAAS
ncbi:VOC family protein [Iamia sp. SCSIO 61187]|uniref:VOC family protein n=1 Tax=Iamia sp. SCSIO 61187 TaxID=2722752 RepID=UPI002107AD0A|nr:VOC family protein [Iamia sp. SCSIO 61187]QYG94998.1 VOC family protein [Iamia sp. SCSIO 61187]